MRSLNLAELTWPDVEAYLSGCQTVIIPLGAVEQHGPAMPLGTDVMIAQSLAHETAKTMGRLVAPALSPGISLIPHMNFKGTISFSTATFTSMIIEFITSLHRHGFRNFLLINGHGGNDGAVKNAVIECCHRLDDMKINWANWWTMKDIAEKAVTELGGPIGHGCAAEVSLIMNIDENLVVNERLSREFSGYSFTVSNNLAGRYSTETGLMNADQAGASKELGRILQTMAVKNYCRMIEEMEKSSERQMT